MTTATEDAREVYFPNWLSKRVARVAYAVEGAARSVGSDEAFVRIMEEGDGPELTESAHQVLGAQAILNDVSGRLRALRCRPSDHVNEISGTVQPIWDCGYRCNAAAAALRAAYKPGSPGSGVLIEMVEALANALHDLGTVTDDRQARESRRS